MPNTLTINGQMFPVEEIIPFLQQYQLLTSLLREVLVDREIASIVCGSEEIREARETFYRQFPSENARQKWQEDTKITPERVEAIAVRKLKIEKFKEATWGPEIESYFLKRKPFLDRYVYSLLRVKDMGIARELYFRLQLKEQPFTELAREYSQGSERYTMGIIGPVTLDVPDPTLARILARSPKGKLVEPISLKEWVAIIRVEDVIPAQLDTTMRNKLLEELFQLWLQEELKTAKIDYNNKGS